MKNYVPAAGRDWALPLYDPILWLLGGNAVRRVLIDQAGIRPGHRVLEIGCGTGALLMAIHQAHPGAEIAGLDPDPKALALARRKATRAAASIRLDQGFADRMSYPEASFDRVLSCFMFHHLPADEKLTTLGEARRVLQPGGSFHMLDFGGGKTAPKKSVARWLHAPDNQLEHNAEDRVLALMREAGFADSRKVRDGAMLLGSLRVHYYQGSIEGV